MFVRNEMKGSEVDARANYVVLISWPRPLLCHKLEFSSISSKKVVHNSLAFISVENFQGGINIKGIVTSYIWTKKGIFLYNMQFDELFLLRLFVHMGSEHEPKLKEKQQPTPPGWIEKGFSSTSKLQKIWVFSLDIEFNGIYCT